ncbi:hypothetical protein TWF694_004624 [Orbilia ellipsospora]|uniref:Uncharacterized protein n=1 Tax=Orbilia ellipsospora TaxID=2528407 RepID=A0AAV9WVP6_9PEZI
MSELQPVYVAAKKCQEKLAECLEIPHLMQNGWAESRLVDFNLWVAGAGVFAKERLSLDMRLSTKLEIRNAIVSLLVLLRMFIENCLGQARSHDEIHDQPITTEQSNIKNPDGDDAYEISASRLYSKEIEARKDVEVTLNQIVRLTVAIRKAGSDARLKRADRSFDLASPKIQDLKEFLELIIHPRGFKKEGQLTPIQLRLIEANLRRWHRFDYAKLHSKKLARRDTALRGLPGSLASILHDGSTFNPKPEGSFDITRREGATAVALKNVVPQVEYTIPLTATTAASAIEGTIIISDRVRTRTSATVISRVSSKISYPRPPNVQRSNTVFKCPCCQQSLPVAYTEHSQWKKHLAGDILPYTCVFQNCDQPFQLYLTREDWEHHIKTDHGQLWKCAACEQLGKATEFSIEDALVDHLRAIHSDSVDPEEIPMFVMASLSPKTVETIDCPLCLLSSEGEEDPLEHIAHCIHDFSLNSLPLPSDSDEEEDYFDVSSRNSDLLNTPSSYSAEIDDENLIESGSDTSTVENQHEVSEVSVKNLLLHQESSEAKGISILDWTLEQVAEDLQIGISTSALDKSTEEPTTPKLRSHSSMDRTLDILGARAPDDEGSNFGAPEDNADTSDDGDDENDMGSSVLDRNRSTAQKGDDGEKGNPGSRFERSQNASPVVLQSVIPGNHHLPMPFDTVNDILEDGPTMNLADLSSQQQSQQSSAPPQTSSLPLSDSTNQPIHRPHSTTSPSIMVPQPEQRTDWSVDFNPNVPHVLSIDLVHTLEHTSVVCCVRFSHDGKYLATGCNKSAQIFDAQTGHQIALFQTESVDAEDEVYIRSVCFSPDGYYLATGSEGGQLKVWDIKKKRIVHDLRGHVEDIYSLGFSSDASYIASCGGDQTVKIWYLKNIDEAPVTFTLEQPAVSIAISPDSKFVALAFLNGYIQIWDVSCGKCVASLQASARYTNSDTDMAFAVPEDNEGHCDAVYSVTFNADGTGLISGSLDRTVKKWPISCLSTPQNFNSKPESINKTFKGHEVGFSLNR